MKTVIQIVLWLVSFFLAFMIYKSIMGPIEFRKVRKERFQQVINKLKDIRDAQEAYKTVNDKYASNFEGLIKFIDTGSYTITTQKDSSFMRFDRAYGIELQVDTIVIDTLGFKKVKDSLFKSDDRYKSMMNVPFGKNGETFELAADIIDKSGYKAPVFEAKVKKDVVLYDQPNDLRAQENARNSVEEVNGEYLKVGSMTDVSTNGNWPPIYDQNKD